MKDMKITDYTNAIVINGEVHQFKRSNKRLTCDDCSLRGKAMYTEDCKFKDVCSIFKDNWQFYKFGVFKKEKNTL